MDRPIQSLGIFAGSGFHDTGVELALDALGYRLRPVGYVEREAAAAATLLARMETQTLGRAPVWCDCISRLDAKPLRGFVDLLIASPPCQPYSSAGKRLGTKDERSHGDGDGPLVHLARIFDECRPSVGWFENVPEWFTDGHFREFGEELSRLGYGIADPVFATSAGLGNVHERERVFCMVYADRLHQGRRAHAERGAERGDAAGGAGGAMGDAQHLRAGTGEQGEQGQARLGRDRPADAGAGMADANVGGREGNSLKRGRKGSGIRRNTQRGGQGVAQPSRGGFGELRESSWEDGQPDGGDQIVADSDGAGLRVRGERQGEHGDASKLISRLGEPSSEGREGRERAGAPAEGPAPRGPVGEPSGPRLRVPLVPPGRDDYRRWAALAAQGLDPTLFPAIESGVSVVADALAPSASDLLRIGGNGVDPLVVCYAFLRSIAQIGGALW